MLHSIIWRLVNEQHGVIARWQLLALGMNAAAIDRRMKNGRLLPVFRGVFAVGRPQLSREGWWMAAVLACGPNAVLSDLSAGGLWAMLTPWGPIHVTVPPHERHKRRGIVVHRRHLADADVTRHMGIPVIAVVPTLVDLATTLSPRRVGSSNK